MTSVQERLVALVSRPPASRGHLDTEHVLPWVRRKSELLQKLDKDTLKDVIRNCGYQKSVKDDVIITQGELGDCFYILLTGRVGVYIDTAKSDEDTPTDGPTTDQKGSNSGENDGEKREDENIQEDGGTKKGKKPLNRAQFGKFIMNFEAGKSFGEIALISDNRVRNATIIADMDSDLLVIDRDLFNVYMKASQEAEYSERRRFVETSSLFRGWSAKFRSLLEMSLRKEVYPYGSVIMTQGDPVTGLVFILSGQAKLVMEPARHQAQYGDIITRNGNKGIPTRKPDRVAREGWTRRHREPVTSAQIDIRRKLGYAAAERRVMSRSVDVCSVERGEVIGDTEMVLDLETNMETVISTANTTVLVLNPKNYERLVAKKHGVTVTRLRSWAYDSNKKLMENPYAKLRTLREIDDYGKIRRKVPRSIQQLKNNLEAERELMKDDTRELVGTEPDDTFVTQGRPRTSGVVSRRARSAVSRSPRPKSAAAVGLKIRECDLGEDHFSFSPNHPDAEHRLAHDAVAEIFEEMDILTREAQETRMRLVCSGYTRQDSPRSISRPDEAGEDEYFDWETSEANLKDLEQRVEQFCRTVTPARPSSNVSRPGTAVSPMRPSSGVSRPSTAAGQIITEMRRFDIEEPNSMPLPGGTVYVHKKPCRFPVASNMHRHVRRFILTREQRAWPSMTPHATNITY